MFEKKLKSLIKVHTANKIDNYNRVGKKKEKKTQKKFQDKSKYKKNKCISWVPAVSIFSLAGSHSPPHLPRMPSNTALVSGPAVGTTRTLIWSYTCVFLPPISTDIRSSAFSFRGALSVLFIFHRHSVCLVCRDTDCLSHINHGPITVYFQVSGSWQSEGLFN